MPTYLSPQDCPSFLQLIERATGSMPLGPALQAHLAAGCPACVRRESILASILRVAAAPAWPPVPADWRRRAVALAAAPAPAGTAAFGGPALGRVRELVARLVTDFGGLPRPAPALRGRGPSDRHLLYAAGPFEIDLALFDSGALVGQVLAGDGDDEALAAGVCVLYGAARTREAALELGGDFHFADVLPGAYDLLLESPRVRLLVHDVDLAAEPEVEQ
jgi:hypothetical protein